MEAAVADSMAQASGKESAADVSAAGDAGGADAAHSCAAPEVQNSSAGQNLGTEARKDGTAGRTLPARFAVEQSHLLQGLVQMTLTL